MKKKSIFEAWSLSISRQFEFLLDLFLEDRKICLGTYTPWAKLMATQHQRWRWECIAGVEKLRYPTLLLVNVYLLRINNDPPDFYFFDDEKNNIMLVDHSKEPSAQVISAAVQAKKSKPTEFSYKEPVHRILRCYFQKEKHYGTSKKVWFRDWKSVNEVSAFAILKTFQKLNCEKSMTNRDEMVEKNVDWRKCSRVANALNESVGVTTITKQILYPRVYLIVESLFSLLW